MVHNADLPATNEVEEGVLDVDGVGVNLTAPLMLQNGVLEGALRDVIGHVGLICIRIIDIHQSTPDRPLDPIRHREVLTLGDDVDFEGVRKFYQEFKQEVRNHGEEWD